MTSRDVKQSFRAYPTALARERTMSAVSFLSSVRGAPVLARRAKQSDGARALPRLLGLASTKRCLVPHRVALTFASPDSLLPLRPPCRRPRASRDQGERRHDVRGGHRAAHRGPAQG